MVQFFRERHVILLLAIFGAPLPINRAAAQSTAQFDVTATITSGCQVDGLGNTGNAGTIGTLDFGVDSTFSNARRTASTTAGQAIRLRCTPGVTLQLSVDGGNHSQAGTRRMENTQVSGAYLSYSVCQDASCNLPIAIGASTSVPVSSANSEDVRLPIYGALDLPGTLSPGIYTDTLTVTLTW